MLYHVQLFVTPRTVALQTSPSMGFSRPEYCSGLPFPSPGALPDPGMEPRSPALQADSVVSEVPGKPDQSYMYMQTHACTSSLSSPHPTPLGHHRASPELPGV